MRPSSGRCAPSYRKGSARSIGGSDAAPHASCPAETASSAPVPPTAWSAVSRLQPLIDVLMLCVVLVSDLPFQELSKWKCSISKARSVIACFARLVFVWCSSGVDLMLVSCPLPSAASANSSLAGRLPASGVTWSASRLTSPPPPRTPATTTPTAPSPRRSRKSRNHPPPPAPADRSTAATPADAGRLPWRCGK